MAGCNKLLVEFDLRQNFGYLFGLFPFVTQVNTHLNEIANDVCLGPMNLICIGWMAGVYLLQAVILVMVSC